MDFEIKVLVKLGDKIFDIIFIPPLTIPNVAITLISDLVSSVALFFYNLTPYIFEISIII